MHAFMIIAHHRFNMLKKLIMLLDDDRNDIYIHISAKVKDFDFEGFKKNAKKSRIIFTPERVNIEWGDETQVLAEMALLKTALANEYPKNRYTYFHLISGADLPIKSNDYIHAFFDKHAGKEFIHFTDDTVSGLSISRLRYYHFFRSRRNTFNKILSQALLKPQQLFGVNRLKGTNIKVQKGSNWFSITHDLAQYAVNNEEKITKVFSHTYCGDEMFIQTLALTGGFEGRLYMYPCNNNQLAAVRLIDWDRGSPYVWRTSDFDEIINSPAIFARKFDEDIDSVIIDRVFDYISSQNKSK